MSIERKIYVNNDLDVVVARMQAREMAKEMGFGTADQARISLAASELARALSWNPGQPGEIILSQANRNGQKGLELNCLISLASLTAGDQAIAGQNQSIGGARQLVDESRVETEAENRTRVILIKWLK